MGSVVEAKVGGLYMNALELSPMRTTLEELDHPHHQHQYEQIRAQQTEL